MNRITPSLRTSLRRAAWCGLLVCTQAAAGCNEGPTEEPPPAELGEIVFCRGSQFSCEMTVINPDGSGARPISLLPAADPSWSPDGSRIAFLSWQDQNVELLLWHRDGSTRRLTRTVARTELSPAWSPDGSRIVFAGIQSYKTELFIINADGTGERQLTTNQDPAWRPDWSPEGRSIAFQVGNQVAVMDVEGGGEPTVLANGESPAWSPDGTRIAFARRGDSATGSPQAESGIFTMAPDGSAVTRVTSGLNDGEPDWSPDGRRLVFTRNTEELHVVNADGTGLAAVTRDSVHNVSPSWRP